MEGDPRELEERFAEWYVWAKREVATDSRVCLGAAQAAVEAIEGGASEEAARVAARGSTAGHGVVLVSRIPPRRRAYAEWYDWARREVGGGRERQHASARAALDRLDAGSDAAAAATAARAAVGTPGALPDQAPQPGPPPLPAPPVAPAPVATVAPAYSTYQPYAIAQPPPIAPKNAYASFLRRAAAWLIDTVLLLVGFLVLYFVGNIFIGIGLLSSGQNPTIDNALGAEFVLLLIMFVLAWLYYAGLESSAWQGTVGKRLLRVVVTDQSGRRVKFGRATGRFFAKIVSALVLFVGYLMVLFSERRQALHDLMASTFVVRQEHLALLTTPPQPAPVPQETGQPGAGEVQGA